MPLNLANYEKRSKEAVMAFWGNREMARQKQIEAGKADQGERAGVTAGKNMDGFISIGTAHDFFVAYREGAFGSQPPPFVGWLMLVEDAPASRSPVRDKSPNFKVFPEFEGASYLKRYDILCQRLVKEKLYSAASVIASPRTAAGSGAYSEMSELAGLGNFVRSFAAHIAQEASR